MGGVKRFARGERTRKIPSLLLLVALVSSVALFGLAGPATAAPGTNQYSVFIGPDFGPTPANDKNVFVEEGSSAEIVRITFENLISNTKTQRLGAAQAVFDPALTVVAAGTVIASGGQTWVSSVSGNTVLIQATADGQRILPSQTVSVDVTLGTPPLLATTEYPVATKADQTTSGDFSGGNLFTLIGDPVTVTVGQIEHCDAGQDTCSTGQDPDDQGGFGTVECNNCKFATTLIVDFQENFCLLNDCIAVWDANSVPDEGTEPGTFYLVIQIPPDFQGNPEIIIWNGTTFVTVKNCGNQVAAPCIDTNLTDKQAGIYYLKLDDDPIGGYR